MSIQYFGFWSGFYHDNENSGFRNLLQTLLASFHNITINIHSVFSYNKRLPIKAPDVLTIQYSGEPFFEPTEHFDLNLIMEPDDLDNKIVWCSLFALGSYEYNYWPLYQTPRPTPVQKRRFCAFVVTNEKAQLRNRFFEKLCRYKFVDSCGSSMNNCGFRAPFAPREYHDFLQRYKFMICFENTSKTHYITEKLYNAYLGGTIPIYWGCTNAPKWLNPKSFLYLEDGSEEAMDRLITRIIELDNDDAKYAAMYREVLVPDGIPYDMQLTTIQSKIEAIVKK